ncbi:hypothetical protein AAY473_002426 [Plecturocebus cupreus]
MPSTGLSLIHHSGLTDSQEAFFFEVLNQAEWLVGISHRLALRKKERARQHRKGSISGVWKSTGQPPDNPAQPGRSRPDP